MTEEQQLQRTVLFDLHVEHGGKMVPFAGWEMPVQYSSGVKQETLSVRSHAGIFDASHMGEIVVEGPQAGAWLDALVTNHLQNLDILQARYCLMLQDDGGVIDDLIVYRTGPETWYVVCNASNRDAVWQHLQNNNQNNVTLQDESDRTALLAVQGPQARTITGKVLGIDPDAMPRRFRAMEIPGDQQGLLARTGYTGEDGVELFLPAENAPKIWAALVEAGAIPAGLGARDVCRVEAGLPLYGHEMDLAHGPRGAGLMFAVQTDKEFKGRDAVLASKGEKLIGLQAEGRGIPREGYEVQQNGTTVGVITSGTFSPHLESGIAMARVQDSVDTEAPFAVLIRNKAWPMQAVSLPFIHQFKK